MAWTLDDFDYPLPQELIAQAPLDRRTDSRLLQVGPPLTDLHFSDLPTLLAPGDLLVFNDTRVIHARLFGTKDTGGQVEVMIERPLGGHEALAQVRASKSPKPGSRLHLEGALDVEVLGRRVEAAQLDHRGEGGELLDIEVAHGADAMRSPLRRPEVLSEALVVVASGLRLRHYVRGRVRRLPARS